MRALILAAALIATPASAKTWFNEDCTLGLQSGEGGFEIMFNPGVDMPDKRETVCKVAHWPIQNPVAILKCDNGSEPEMQLIDSDVRLDGVMLYSNDTGRFDEVCD